MEAKVPPFTRSTRDEFRFENSAAKKLFRRFEHQIPALPTEALAAFAQSAAIGYLGQRDRIGKQANYLRQIARTFGGALAGRAITMHDGRGYSASPGRPPDPQVTGNVGNSLLDVLLATGQVRYARDVSAAVRTIVSRANRWPARSRRPVFGAVDGAPRFAVRAPGARNLYDEAATATVAVFLDRAASVDMSATSTGSLLHKADHAQIARQRDLSNLAAGLVADHFLSTHAQRYVDAGSPLGLTEFARVAALARITANPDLKQLATGQGSVLAARVFLPSGQPRPQGTGLPSGLALNALDPASDTFQRVILWTLGHARRDGTVRLGASSDSLTQGYVALALERRIYLLERGAVREP